MDNSYERVQGERPSSKLGFGEDLGAQVLKPVRAMVKAYFPSRKCWFMAGGGGVINRKGHDTTRELEAVIQSVGPAMTIAILMLIGRYMSHAMIVNSLDLDAPVPSPLETKP